MADLAGCVGPLHNNRVVRQAGTFSQVVPIPPHLSQWARVAASIVSLRMLTNTSTASALTPTATTCSGEKRGGPPSPISHLTSTLVLHLDVYRGVRDRDRERDWLLCGVEGD